MSSVTLGLNAKFSINSITVAYGILVLCLTVVIGLGITDNNKASKKQERPALKVVLQQL